MVTSTPGRFFGFGKVIDVIADTEHLAGAEVGAALARSVPFENAIHAIADQIPDRK